MIDKELKMNIPSIPDNLRNEYDAEFVSVYENIFPKMKEAEDQILANDPNIPEDKIQAIRYKDEKIDESGLFYELGIHTRFTEQDYSKLSIRDERIPSFDGEGIPVRIYRPANTDNNPVPVHFNYHGGGFAIGGLSFDGNRMTQLCLDTNVMIIDVDYRMCPEFAFPHSLFDAYSILKYVYVNFEKYGIDQGKVSCGGISAGGNLALGVAHLCRDNNFPLKLVLSSVPKVDNYNGILNAKDARFNETVQKYSNGVILGWNDIILFEKILQDTNKTGKKVDFDNILYKELDIRVNPDIVTYYTDIILSKNFNGLPRHVIITGGCDPLEEAAREYAKTLIDNKVDTRYHCATGCVHWIVELHNLFKKGKKVHNILVDELTAQFK